MFGAIKASLANQPEKNVHTRFDLGYYILRRNDKVFPLIFSWLVHIFMDVATSSFIKSLGCSVKILEF